MLESRHLVGLFLGVVLLCGVFFTLGYVMGKTQYGEAAVHAASVPNGAPVRSARVKAAPPVTPSSPASTPNASEWDFYGNKPKNDDHLQPAAKSSSPWASSSSPARTAPVPRREPKPSAREVRAAERFRAPRMARGSIVLQVAALRHEGDAMAMAGMLQRKRFPSFVVTPKSDNFYRVQVGPYRNERAAESARRALERAGFKSIMKR